MMIRHYIKIAFRNSLKHKTQNIITIFCLSIGILCFSIVYYYVNQYMRNPYSELPHYHQMASLKVINTTTGNHSSLKKATIAQLEQQPLSGIDLLALSQYGYNEREVIVINEEGKENIYQSRYTFVNSEYFIYLGVHSIYTHHLPTLNKGEVILSESYARQLFGKKNPIGNKLTFAKYPTENTETVYYTIKDVIPDFGYIQNDYDSNSNLFFSYLDAPDWLSLEAKVLINKSQTFNQVDKALENRIVFQQNDTLHFKTIPLYKRYEIDKGKFVAMLSLLLIASLILTAGLINFLKFTIQSFYNRIRELGLRKCLGSSYSELFRMLSCEVLLILLLSFLLTLAFSESIIPYLYHYLPLSYQKYIYIDVQQLNLMELGIFIFVLLLCMIIAAISVIKTRYISIRQSISGRKQGKHVFRNLMMGVQLIICFFFTGMTFGILQLTNSMRSAMYTPVSSTEYKKRLQLELSGITFLPHAKEIHQQLKSLPNVLETVIISYNSYMNYETRNQVKLYGKVTGADSNYLSFFNIPLLKGEMPKKDEEDVVYISENLDRIMQKDSAQSTITIHSKTYRIAGVYKAAPYEKLNPKYMEFSVYIPTTLGGNICLRVVPGTQKEVKKEIEKICRRYAPETIPLNITTMYQSRNTAETGPIDMACDIAIFLSAISLLFAVLSIYSAISLDTKGRQKEIAIRKITGATPRTIGLLFGRLYILLLTIGFGVAFPLVYYIFHTIMGNDLKDFSINFYRIGACSLVCISMVILITIGYKIYRIMKLNPAEVIKSE